MARRSRIASCYLLPTFFIKTLFRITANYNMAYIKSDKSNYYLQKVFAFVFGVVFSIAGIGFLIDPGGTITVNDEQITATYMNTLPFLIIGLIASSIFIWMCFNYFRAVLTEDQVQIEFIGSTKKYKWEEFEYIVDVNWSWKGSVFKFKPLNKKAFYVHADRGKINFNSVFNRESAFNTEMSQLIHSKKQELNI